MEIKRVFDILDLLKQTSKKDDILAAKVNKQWVKHSVNDFIENVNLVSSGLLALGFVPGDKVAIIANNRPEWNFVDYGCQQIGIITVPIYPTISVGDLKFILNDSGVKAIFLSSKDIYKKIAEMESEIPNVKYVHSFNEIEGVKHFSEFIHFAKDKVDLEKIKVLKDKINPDELMTILYTSGTTGTPKGVMLCHTNLISNVLASQDLAPFETNWRALSFLPLNHVYERMVNTLYLYKGISIYYAEGLETIGDNLKEIKPHMFVSVPRLIERVYEKLVSAGEKLSGFKKKVFFWALDIALNYELDGANGAWYELKRKIADKLVFSKWREALGGNVVVIASGGAALQPRLARVFMCAKIIVSEGYGLTETSPVISVNCYKKGLTKIGTVGIIHNNVEVKIAEDGEIIVKAPSVMMGYYNRPDATAEVIDEQGYFHTGDIGTIIDGKFLKITDRKKEIFKTSSGKYIAPLMIENRLKECRFIDQCMVIGEGQKYASALLVPSADYMKEWCKQNNVEYTNAFEISSHAEVKKALGAFIREMNKTLAPYEQIKRPEFINGIWSVEGGEMTPKLSLKRKFIMEKYKDVVGKIFVEGEE